MDSTHVIDLGIGQPEDAILPRRSLREAADVALAGPDNEYLQYGPEQGAASVREMLAGFLSAYYGYRVDAGNLLVTNGASHGLDLVLARYTRPGDVVAIEAPSYFFGLDILRDRGVRLVPVPVDGDGLDVGRLQEVLEQHRPKLVYTIPVFHNPTGVTLSNPRRRGLVDLAEEYRTTVVADEVYQLTAEPGRVPPPLRHGGSGQVLSLGSFSKILGPGVRLGWVEGPPDRLAHLADDPVLRSGGGASPMTAAIVESMIRLGRQDEFLDAIRGVYRDRRVNAVAVLRRHLPDAVRAWYPDGGYYVWIELPAGVDAEAVRADALAAGVGYRPGQSFSVDGSFRNCLRLCFTYYPEDVFAAAAERLAKVFSAHLPAQP